MKRYLAIALALLAILSTDVVRVATYSTPTHHHRTAAPKPSPSATGKAVTWDPRVLPIVKFVEKARGLTFKHPVPVNFLDDAAFNKEVAVPAPDTAKDKAELQQFLETLRSLGLVTGNVDLSSELDDLQQSDVIGLYVPDKKAVFVRGTSLGPYVRTTLAHELTHVLQDQYFGLAKIRKSAPGGDDTAVTALIEGDAVRIQRLYQKQLSKADQKLFASEEQAASDRATGGASDVPEILTDQQSFPYVFGPVLLDALTEKGGNDAVNDAFRNPPTEEAQVFDPVTHPISEKALSLPTPKLPPGGKQLDTVSPFGEVSLFEVLGSRIPYATALSAVLGWKGDTSVEYRHNGKTCEAIDVRTTSASTLKAAFLTWRQGFPGAVITSSGDLVSVRSCDPGAHGSPLPTFTPSNFDVLSARASIIEAFLGDHLSFTVSACITDALIKGLGTARYHLLTATTLPDADVTTLQGLSRAAAQTCGAHG